MLRQINKGFTIYFLFFILFYPAIFFLRINNIESIARIIIPFFIFIIFIFVLLSADINKRRDIILCFVFFFILVGDCVINWSTRKEFSIVPFSLTHIFLGIYYTLDTELKKIDFLFLIPVLFFSSLLFGMVSKDIKGPLFLSAFILYLNILNFMLWRALCYLRSAHKSLKISLVFIGSLFFYVTDIFVSLYAIYDNKLFIELIWIIYPPALFFLSLINMQDSKSDFSR